MIDLLIMVGGLMKVLDQNHFVEYLMRSWGL